MIPPHEVSDPELELEWRRVLDAWDDPKAHARFLALCDAQGALAFAGQRYRRVREQEPARAEQAKKRSDEVLTLAIGRLQKSEAVERSPGRSRAEWIAIGVATSFLLLALLSVARAFLQR